MGFGNCKNCVTDYNTILDYDPFIISFQVEEFIKKGLIIKNLNNIYIYTLKKTL